MIPIKSWSMFTTTRSALGVSGSSSFFVKAPRSGTRALRAATLVASPGWALLRNITRPPKVVMASTLWFTVRAVPEALGTPGATIFTIL